MPEIFSTSPNQNDLLLKFLTVYTKLDYRVTGDSIVNGYAEGSKRVRTVIPMNPTHITQAAKKKLSERLFRLEPRIRYVALNQKGQIKGMRQGPLHPGARERSHRRVDCQSDRARGHGSVGVNLEDDPIEIARKVVAALDLRA